MNQQAQDPSTYIALSESGLVLLEKEFQIIINEVIKGITDVTTYLNVKNELTPELIVSNKIGVIGYSTDIDAIHMPINYLNLVSNNTTPIEYRDQLVCFVPDKFYIILKYIYWLRIFGRESAIHYFQKHGNPKLKVKFPQAFDKNLSPKSLLLSDLEVEARTIGDEIISVNKENSLWTNVDNYFAINFPDYHNKSIDYLTKLQKPKLEISFELESFLA
ncbi:MAG TPA: hypothetical protein VM077_01010 [Candidatus Limnocylindrales bacterium]|nr:hypothetical protein [Candidatus Limnocylindrales bacterium]